MPLPLARLPVLTLTMLTAASLALAACSGKTPDAGASQSPTQDALVMPGDTALPAELDNTDGMQTVAEALKTTGLDAVFNGNASYTLLAPDDDAFAALGDAGKAMVSSTDHAALAALLKVHILPGYVTRQDITDAIDHSANGTVAMTDMAGQDLTFSRTDDGIKVTAPDGASAILSGDAVAGKHSIALPLDGVLKVIAS